ncbi:MAG: signal recognition particle protein [Peptococcaceae bacterium]|nr:signal recognition particle protein [Peptococcaceae bacterium]MBO5301948.1 signal recognition particle protein [Peptococcaceae bacterium]MBO5429289.1 signal recognition particle protein [Peptococcaceae bacterium]MBP3341614.1 signal recognition particle protein [Peptococcaceae bacterium]MBP3585369.1 signal recognition particle protein [Peptococcaceae bacterium]
MAFDGLGDKLQDIFKRMKGQGKISEKDLKAVMREVKVALLEADVNYKVVKQFVDNVNSRAVGEEVMESLTPGQQVVKIVHDELTQLLGGTQSKLTISPKPPTVIMMVGLQGSGKTTTSGKLGRLLKKQGKRPLLTACDVYRPAAIKQLQVLGEQLDIPVFTLGDKISPVDIAKAAIEHAKSHGNDIVILDTAGRLHIDEVLMEELKNVKEVAQPTEILLVVDSMVGQDAVNVADSFNELLDITGVVLTKLDGDTRGGAALSIKTITGKPIKFAGMGEKLDALEPFHPDRMASRILGMGDVMTLIEKAQETVDQKKAEEMSKKLLKAEFTLEDYLDQMEQLQNMGNINSMLEMMPGMSKNKLKDIQIDEKDMARTKAIILSMTPAERRNPKIINGSRRKRIAAGSGMKVQDVNRLLKQYEQSQVLMKQFGGMASGKKGKKGGGKFKLPFGM